MKKIPPCPKCDNLLDEVLYFGQVLNECGKCHGFWFDSNELDQFKSRVDDNIRWIDIDLWRYANRASFNPSQFDCPRCETIMSELQFDGSHVTMEFCVNCGGAWLDKGELEIVIKFVQNKMVAKSLQGMGKEAFLQFSQIFGGPKGMVDEVKDFVAAWRMVSLKFSITHPGLYQEIQAIRQTLPF